MEFFYPPGGEPDSIIVVDSFVYTKDPCGHTSSFGPELSQRLALCGFRTLVVACSGARVMAYDYHLVFDHLLLLRRRFRFLLLVSMGNDISFGYFRHRPDCGIELASRLGGLAVRASASADFVGVIFGGSSEVWGYDPDAWSRLFDSRVHQCLSALRVCFPDLYCDDGTLHLRGCSLADSVGHLSTDSREFGIRSLLAAVWSMHLTGRVRSRL